MWGFQADAHAYARMSAAILKLAAQDKGGSALWEQLKSSHGNESNNTVNVMLDEFEDRLDATK